MNINNNLRFTSINSSITNSRLSQRPISFEGKITLSHTKDSKEIQDLINLFLDSYNHSIMKYGEKSFFYSLVNKFENFLYKIFRFSFVNLAKSRQSVTGVVKNPNNKIVGGYSILLDPIEQQGEISMLAINKKYKNTKSGYEMFITMLRDILQTADQNNLIEIIWQINKNNKPMLNLSSNPRVCNFDESVINCSYAINTSTLKNFLSLHKK